MKTRDVMENEPSIVDRSDRDPRIKVEKHACAVAIDKLTTLIAQLEERLEAVRFRGPRDDREEKNSLVAGGSPLAIDLSSYTDSLKDLQRRVGIILEELEI
jgi:hypothetical protein